MDYTANGVLGIRRQLERVLIFKPVPFASRPHVEARPPVLTWASSWPSSQKNLGQSPPDVQKIIPQYLQRNGHRFKDSEK
jgi:hypothetical protein